MMAREWTVQTRTPQLKTFKSCEFCRGNQTAQVFARLMVDASTIKNAIAAWKSDDLAVATELAQQILANNPNRRDQVLCHQIAGSVALKQCRFSETVSHLNYTDEAQPDVPSLRSELCKSLIAWGQHLLGQGQLFVTLNRARTAWRICPGNAEAALLVGVILGKTNQVSAARACFSRASQRNPRHPGLRLNFANFLANEREWESASNEYRVLLQIRPQNVPALISLWGVLLETGNILAAKQALDCAGKLAPRSAAAHFNLANVLTAMHRVFDSAEHYGEASRPKPWWDVARANWLRKRAETCDWREDWDIQILRVVCDVKLHLIQDQPVL